MQYALGSNQTTSPTSRTVDYNFDQILLTLFDNVDATGHQQKYFFAQHSIECADIQGTPLAYFRSRT